MFEQIMKKSHRRNIFLNTNSNIDRKAYNKQQNLCASLIMSQKENFFSKINAIVIADNKTFLRVVKIFFTDNIKKIQNK